MTLYQVIRDHALENGDKCTWVASLLYVESSINSAVCKSMELTPFKLVLGTFEAIIIDHLDAIYLVESTQNFVEIL